jgi:nitrite reductase (NADH) small subunit/3-phenylpropionate/trans-cinnamate dioxygenase ferredoxin subunit
MPEHIVGETSDIEQGTGKTFTIEGQTIAVFNKGEEFFAIEDTCKHKGGSLGEGELDGDTITCPLHGWQYNITNGECLMTPQVKMKSFPVKVENGEISLEV